LVIGPYDGGQHASLFVVIDAAWRNDIFDREIGDGFGIHGMRLELDGGIQTEVVKVGGHAGLLHVGIEMDIERLLSRLRDGAQRADQFGVGSARIGRLDGIDAAVEG